MVKAKTVIIIMIIAAVILILVTTKGINTHKPEPQRITGNASYNITRQACEQWIKTQNITINNNYTIDHCEIKITKG